MSMKRNRLIGLVVVVPALVGGEPMALAQAKWRAISSEVTATSVGLADGDTGHGIEGSKVLKLTSALPATGTLSTPKGGVDGEAVWLGLGCRPDYRGRDVRDKVAVLFGSDVPSCGGTTRAILNGAVAVLTVNPGPGNVALQSDTGTDPGDPTPMFSIGREDGIALMNMIEDRGTKIHVALETTIPAPSK